MLRSACLLLLASGLSLHAQLIAERVPVGMRGEWVVTKQLSATSLGCFDPRNQESLLGLRLSLSDRALVWNGQTSRNLDPHLRRISGYEFQARYGQKPRDLGIDEDPVSLVQVVPSFGIPVNILLLRDPGTILIDACNIWLEASRDAGASAKP
jgi:hypothetical protein